MMYLRCILIVLSLLRLRLLAAERLFIVGDSVDRQTVLEWCSLHRSDVIKEENWGLDQFYYMNGIAAAYCATKTHSIGFIHSFGAAAKGPYMNNIQNGPGKGGEYVDTKPRLRKALEVYIAIYGAPSRVILQFAAWDAHFILREEVGKGSWGDASWVQGQVQIHIDNLKARYNEVLEVLPGADVGFRTAGGRQAVSLGGGLSLHQCYIIQCLMAHNNSAPEHYNHDKKLIILTLINPSFFYIHSGHCFWLQTWTLPCARL